MGRERACTQKRRVRCSELGEREQQGRKEGRARGRGRSIVCARSVFYCMICSHSAHDASNFGYYLIHTDTRIQRHTHTHQCIPRASREFSQVPRIPCPHPQPSPSPLAPRRRHPSPQRAYHSAKTTIFTCPTPPRDPRADVDDRRGPAWSRPSSRRGDCRRRPVRPCDRTCNQQS